MGTSNSQTAVVGIVWYQVFNFLGVVASRQAEKGKGSGSKHQQQQLQQLQQQRCSTAIEAGALGFADNADRTEGTEYEMFVLTTIKDTVKVAPGTFSGDSLDVLTAQIEAKFADRVIANVGLCVALHSYETIGDPYVYPSDGAAHYKVRFRLLVFRPFVGEILAGKVSSCTEHGIKVSLDFFEHASIPKDLLQSPSKFTRGEWVWSYPDGDADDDGEGAKEGSDAEETTFSLALHDEVRFRVRTLEFTQVTSTATGRLQATTVSTARGGGASGAVAGGAGGGGAGEGGAGARVRERGTSVDLTSVEEAPSAMTITGSMNEEGLGLLSWWE
eukprot:jgi/Undpi1/11693/HiC_scaffold_36.g13988.m1